MAGLDPAIHSRAIEHARSILLDRLGGRLKAGHDEQEGVATTLIPPKRRPERVT